MKTLEEQIKIMQAYKEGKKVEFCLLEDADKPDAPYISFDTDCRFNWLDYDYRIVKTRPMTFKEIADYWKSHRDEIFQINGGMYEGQIDSTDWKEERILIAGRWYTVEEFRTYANKEDGSLFEVTY